MTEQGRPGKYPDVVRRQAVRLVVDHRGEYESEWAAITSIAAKSGMTAETSTLILRAVGNIVVGLFSGSGDGLDEVAGPVGMISVIGTVRTDLPPIFLVWFIGLISANLAVINLLPIPPLDGSRMLMAVVQKASGDRVSPETERLVYFTGWLVLMAFLVWVTISDIQRIAS